MLRRYIICVYARYRRRGLREGKCILQVGQWASSVWAYSVFALMYIVCIDNGRYVCFVCRGRRMMSYSR